MKGEKFGVRFLNEDELRIIEEYFASGSRAEVDGELCDYVRKRPRGQACKKKYPSIAAKQRAYRQRKKGKALRKYERRKSEPTATKASK